MPPNEPALNVGAGNPVHLATGNKYQFELDLPAGVRAPGLEIARHYNSLDQRRSVFGRGWSLSYEARLRRVGKTWQIVQPDGSRVRFSSSGALPTPNRHGTLRAEGRDWIWTWPGGRKLRFDRDGRLIGIRYGRDQAITLERHGGEGPLRGTLSRVRHSGGATLAMHYRIHGKHAYLSGIDSPAGPFRYRYEAVSGVGDGKTESRPLRLAGMTRPDGMRRDYLYEPRYQGGNPWRITGIVIASPDGGRRKRIDTWAYDKLGRAILSIQGPPGSSAGKVSIEYRQTPNGERNGLTIVTDARGDTSRFTTAIRGGRHVLLAASGAGCPGCPASGSRARYDDGGRLVRINGTRIVRDAGGAIRAIEAPRSGWPSLAIRYQANGQRQSWRSSATGTETVRYDRRHLPVRRRFANGDVWRYTYDAGGRPVLVEETSGGKRQGGSRPRTQTTVLSWRGRLLARVAHPNQTEERRYDALGRLAQRIVARPGSQSGPGHLYRASFRYDAHNRLVRHELPEGGALAYSYAQGRGGRLRRIDWIDRKGAAHPVIVRTPYGYRYGNGLNLVARYSKGRLSDLAVIAQHGILLAESRHYNARGQLVRERHASPNRRYDEVWRYAYDKRARMIGAEAVSGPEAGKAIWYAWRADGTLAARRENGRTQRPSIHRDPSGLPQRVGDIAMDYGPGRRPVRASRNGATLATYRHNAFGQRIAAIRPSGRTDYFYLGNKVVAESRRPATSLAAAAAAPGADGGNTAAAGKPAITRRYIYAGHVLVGIIDYANRGGGGAPGTGANTGKTRKSGGHARRDADAEADAGATLYAVHSDMLGAPRAVTDAGQALRWLAAYTPTGRATRIAGDLALDARLPGQMFDAATGWHDNILRTYSPGLGHFLEPDPLGPVPGNQAFGYARQRPRRYIDPLGLLLFAFDGTRNNAQTRTNVWKMSRLYQDGPIFYQAGPGNPRDLDWDAVTAYSAPDILSDQWASLLRTLAGPGSATDTIPIDIIGFSRGAALARHFANQINNYVLNGYFSYTDAQQGTVSACVDLRFMGLFDTVAQFGLLGARDANYDLTIAAAWEWVAHAVALHERRWLFPLTSVDSGGGNTVEAPFIGAHADIGGGIAVDEDGRASSRGDLSDVALNWMLWQARAASVRLGQGESADTEITSPILHDERAALVRSAQNGDRRVNAPDGTKRVNYQDDHERLGREQRAATEAFIARIDSWRRARTTEVGTVDMAGYAQWLHDELGWQALPA